VSACRGCGREIVWVLTQDGKKIPLDRRPVIYRHVGNDSHGTPIVDRVEPLPFHAVSHFATCSKANEFSGSKRTQGA
jgi:hypothetical protein